MRPTGNVHDGINLNSENETTESQHELVIDEETAQVVNYIFESLSGLVRAFQYDTASTKRFNAIRREYTFALMQAGIKSMDRINAAIAKMRKENVTFLPSAMDFVKYCRVTHAEINAPSPQAAYREACRNSHPSQESKYWSHPAVKHAANATGTFFISNSSATESQPIFFENYDDACQMFSDGRIMSQIENRKPTQAEFQDVAWHEKNPQIKLPYNLEWVREYVKNNIL